LGSIPVRNNGGDSVSRGGRKAMQLKEEGKFGRVCSLTGLQKRRKRVEEGRATAALRMAGGDVAAGKHSGAPCRAQERTPGKG
jgi:hypothetical protein